MSGSIKKTQAAARVLDGRLVSDFLLKRVKRDVQKLNRKKIKPKLCIILVGKNPASLAYIRQKERATAKTGIDYVQKNLPASTSTKKLIQIIEKLNSDKKIHGILVQLPLPAHINESLIIRAIDPAKDVDGFQAYNVGKMFLSRKFEDLAPCTPRGITRILEYYKIPVEGEEVVIVGRSNIVGKPMAAMFINRGATVTVCNSKTKNLAAHTKRADILVVAVGKPKLIKASMIKKGAIVIDVGTTKVDNKLVGDVDFKNVQSKASWITPVPGGIGPMTVACLMENVTRAAERQSISDKSISDKLNLSRITIK